MNRRSPAVILQGLSRAEIRDLRAAFREDDARGQLVETLPYTRAGRQLGYALMIVSGALLMLLAFAVAGWAQAHGCLS